MLPSDQKLIPPFPQQDEMGRSVEYPILLNDKENKKSSPPKTTVSEKPNGTPVLLPGRALGTRIGKIPGYA